MITSPTRLSAYVQAIGLRGPGLESWPAAQPVLAGQLAYRPERTVLPSATRLPPAERRRIGAVVKIALAVADEALAQVTPDEAGMPTIFSSSGGDGENYHLICSTLASDDRALSPTRFHNSVHNAPSGYWSIASGDRAPSQVLCAHDGSFAAGLLEAFTQLALDGGRIAVVAYEADYPEPLRTVRPIPDAFGIALVLAAAPDAQARFKLTIELGDSPADTLAEPALEALRGAIPSARSLPLAALLASGVEGSCVLEYLPGSSLRVEVARCN
jgi:Beta-ketoacyl synthase, N-terminal domain